MGLVFTKNKLTTAVLICGWHDEGFGPLTRDNPVCMLPVLNRPFLEYTIDFLRARGIERIFISGPRDDTGSIAHFVGALKQKYSELNVAFVEEDKPKGSAGALRDLKESLSNENFLVINSNILISEIDFDDIYYEHTNKKSVITIGVTRERNKPMEGISIDKDGTVKSYTFIHPSRDRRSPFKPVGIYLFNHEALNYIKEKGYYDIKEQLIPALRAVDVPVHAYEIDGYCKPINSVDDYYNVQRESLFRGSVKTGNMTEIAAGVWAGDNTFISPRAYIVGPTIIGRNCKIEDNAQIIGPTVIGDNCTIGKRAKIRESILWNDFEMEEDSSLKYCIVGRGLRVFAGDSFNNKVVVDSLKLGDLNLIPPKYEFSGVVESVALKMGGFKYAAFLGLKRLIDMTGAFFLLVLAAPILAALAIAVKMDSDGPAIFRQKRCGKHGVDFEMLKFRTMVKDAHKMQQKLVTEKNVDGPMFKLVNDPRITKTGQFLRKTSLDELPQLFNVLKGDMSLVGPRPLVMDEMKFSPSWRSIRLKVKPGITGLWQVQGRSEAPFHDWIRHDVHYVQNQSLWMDIKILIKTIRVVFQKAGAY
ncbi:MAG: sugar transferase [Deltaproteobacteria bacterium]|nr:sugar transferase [Deltaproteobacteria bacterium]